VAAGSRQRPDSHERCLIISPLRSRTAACCSTVRLTAAFAHVFFSDGGRRVLLIKLNPCPLRVAKCLAQVWIVAAFEYGSYPSDVGHGTSEAPLSHSGDSASSSRCIDRMRSLTLLRRTARALFLAPSCLTLSVIFVTDVGCGLVFGYHIKCVDG
jgi:hypothetical protein